MSNFNNKIRVGIIGFGRMGITHYSIINSHPDVEVTAIADTSTLVLGLISKYVPNLNIYTDYNDLFNNEKLDAVIISTPPTSHFPIALKAAEKNIHVFSEKPFTTKSIDAQKLSNIFEQRNLQNHVGYVNRNNDIFRTVNSYIKRGLIGNVIRFKSEMYSCTIIDSTDSNTWSDSTENGGGALFDMASHAIDLVNFIIGKPDKVTGSSLIKIYSKHVEDAVNATLLYKCGISGTINVNWSDDSYRKPTNKIEIFGSLGKIIADQHSIKIFMKNNNPELSLHKGWNTRYITDVFKPVPFYVRGNEFTYQLYQFIECIKNSSSLTPCTFQDSSYTLEVIESIFNDFKLNGSFK